MSCKTTSARRSILDWAGLREQEWFAGAGAGGGEAVLPLGAGVSGGVPG